MPSNLPKLLLTVMAGSGATPAQRYAARVLATNPLRYNKLNEGTGTNMVDSSTNAFAGTYVGVTWDGVTQSPVGEAMPSLDGVNDYGNLYSAAFASVFNLDEFTILMWFMVNASSVWTDGTARRLFHIERNGTNRVFIQKLSSNNSISFSRAGNGTSKTINAGSQSDTGLVCIALSGSIAGGGLLAAGDLRAYKNGAQLGTTQTGGVAAAGSGFDSGRMSIGAEGAFGAFWHGWMAQVILWNRPIDNDILALMTI